jgi:transporter family protein
VFYFRALQLGKVAQVAPIDKMSVAFAIIIAAIFLGEIPSIKVAIGAALVVAGSLVIAL